MVGRPCNLTSGVLPLQKEGAVQQFGKSRHYSEMVWYIHCNAGVSYVNHDSPSIMEANSASIGLFKYRLRLTNFSSNSRLSENRGNNKSGVCDRNWCCCAKQQYRFGDCEKTDRVFEML